MNFDTKRLDATDYKILRQLTEDGRMSDVALGERLNLSSTAVARRRKILEESGIISGYTVNLNYKTLGLSIIVIVSIELSSQAEHALNDFEQAVLRSPSMSFCSFVSGDTDFIMILNVASFETYDSIYRRELSTLPHVAKIRSSFVMREVRNITTPPIVFHG
ncbi:Lrp/AsnC family transcriptional regulator [Asticcacaulis machinosus]|uniref:Lrp/AsnC family transcriptional regulator n=1 Tax=Asticcacaulis machinosus TaxID=2984211 RepID=A0ABT5HHS3_9CAUL|nr:Lrp/AsnC family transcriptional regulator [Asticcacaulis machinosus]MDC7675799.1 Lrp/AsnC family transcriptional regulator [Asticcacaulis machinosus]